MILATADLQGILMRLLPLITKMFSRHLYSKKHLASSCMQRSASERLKIEVLYREAIKVRIGMSGTE